jgi:NADPH2:quinone reductase
MKAVRVHRPGGPEALKYEEVPTPVPGQGQVLVRIEAAGVNFVDIYNRSGQYRSQLPFTVGQEAAGVVERAGPGVDDLRKGDRVVYTGVPGAYAEYAVAPAERLVKVPLGMESKVAAAVFLQGMTAHYLACSTWPLKQGDVCLVHAAAGGVGLLLVQIAKMRGAKVIGTVSTPAKAAEAKRAGADEVINYATHDFEAEVRRITDGKGIQVAYDAVGKTTFDKSLACLAQRGMLILYGQASGAVPPFDLVRLGGPLSLFVTRPSLAAYTATRQELVQRANEVLGWVSAGKLKVKVDSTFRLAEAPQAHTRLEGRASSGKILLVP